LKVCGKGKINKGIERARPTIFFSKKDDISVPKNCIKKYNTLLLIIFI